MKVVNNYPVKLRPFGLFSNAFFSDIENSVKNLNDILKKPQTNIIENEDNFQIQLNVPGFEKENVSIEVIDNVLYIKGSIEQENEEKKDNFKLKEFETSSFERSFKLGEKLDSDNIEAQLTNGILFLTINKVEISKPEPKRVLIS